MLRQMIFTQWKWSRLELGFFCVAGFIAPVVTMKVMTANVTSGRDVIPIPDLLAASTGIGAALLTLAFIASVTLAVRPWTLDEARGHVFAQSLPLRWADFVRLRFVAGAALLALPAVAVWLGSVLAAVAMPIPDSLHAYPTSLAIRFLAGALVMYATAFAYQYVAGRRAGRVGAWLLVGYAVIELVLVTLHLPTLTGTVWNFVTSAPGPFRVMTSRWMLLDV